MSRVRPVLIAPSLVIVVLLAAAPGAAQEEAGERRVQACVDARVELLSIVFRLAGNPEYGQGRVPVYTEAVEARFAKLREHAVVRRAAALRRSHGVSYDAVMGLAVHLDDDLRLSVPLAKAERLDRRWPREEVGPFLEELRAFAKAGKAKPFFASQAALYEETARRMQRVIDEHVRLDWFDAFFGSRPTARFLLSLGMLNGGACYGPSVLRTDGTEDLHCVLGVWMTDEHGQPAFDRDVVATVVHEFCHSYGNALADAYAEALAAPAQRLWTHVADAMRAQAYGDWRTMMRESLVRACVVRYEAASRGADGARREIEDQHRRSFHWTGELAALLGRYEQEREAYPTLEAFMPEVVDFFSAYAERFEAERDAAPRVERMEPRNGATDVDPDLRALVITFDRPMQDGNWAIVGGGPHFPKVTGKPSYDEARRVLTVPVELQPAWDYELWLNRGKFDSFQSAEGVKLSPVRVTFRTRAR